jgi:hypothetical protein
MKTISRIASLVSSRVRLDRFLAVVAACGLLATPALFAEPQAAAKTSVSALQRTFDTPKAAADALIAAADPLDPAALAAIFGPDGKDVISTDDAVQDRNQAAAFAAKAREKSEIVPDPKNPDRAILSIGLEDWPLPIPLVRKGGKWSFDSKAGRKEILYRRVGRNELDAIGLCRTFVSAQKEYALEKRDGSQVNQYAQRNVSTPGKQDGLAWQGADGSWEGPLGERIAGAIAEGYSTSSKPQPFHGYLFKVLKGQGPAAHLGQMDFVVKGVMIGGFALVAAPAAYGVTGVKTFMVSHDGVVYEKDLGQRSAHLFRAMERFNPDKSWKPVKD